MDDRLVGEDSGSVPALRDVDFDNLLREVLNRAHSALDEQERLRLLLDAVVTMGADLSLDGVLSRIVTVASSLVDAQYAALGVLDVGRNRRLRTFIHHGMEPVQVSEIGDLPTGHGLLGLLIDDPRPIRLHEIAAHPASYGFPANHPPMKSFLGVPVRIRDRVFGNLYLTEKRGRGTSPPRTRPSWSRSPRRPVSRSRTPASTRRLSSASSGCRRPPRSPRCSPTPPPGRTPCRPSPTRPARLPVPTPRGWSQEPTRTA